MIYDFVPLTENERIEKKENHEKFMAEKAAKKEAELKAKEKENKDNSQDKK